MIVFFSVSTCCFLNTWVELAEWQVSYYARYDPARVTVPAVLCWQLIVFACLLGVWQLLQSRPALYKHRLLLAVAGSAIPFGVSAVALLRMLPVEFITLVQSPWFWPLTGLLLLLFGLLLRRRKVAVGNLLYGVFLHLSPVLLLIVLRGGVAALGSDAPGLYQDGPRAHALPKPPSPNRVVWIIFDELSQEILFDRRPQSLAAPNFDRLRQESVYASSASSPARSTREALPSLIIGENVRQTRPAEPRSLLLTTRKHPIARDWSTIPNVFDNARKLGYNSALAGWYHPYGRLLNHSLTACYWTAGWLLSGAEEPTEEPSLPEAMTHRARCQLNAFPLIGHLPGVFPREYHRQESAARFHYLLEMSRALAADPSMGLVFIHLPVPHPPAIYDRAAKQFSYRRANTYLDAVALSDLALGEIRESIARAGLDGTTALIVSSDHGWRTENWRGTPGWTAEDESISRETDTMGVPFLVKLPHDNLAVTYPRPLNTVVTGSLVLRILNGQITQHAQVEDQLNGR